jgi:aspartate aminotransferase
MTNKVREKEAAGIKIITFISGDPNYDSPLSAQEYSHKAIREGKTHYPPTQGIIELRKSVSDYYQSRFGLSYENNEIVIGAGAKPLIYEAFGCLIDSDDEVIILSPAWVSYAEQVNLFDGRIVVVNTADTDFVPDHVRIANACTSRTVAIVLNSPNNPSGTVYPAETLRAIGLLAKEKNIMIINDEIYERFVYGGEYNHILNVVPEARDYVININGVSKSFAMAGWRIGYALGSQKLIKAISDMQGHLTSGASSISQWASLGALCEAHDECEKMRLELSVRRELLLDLLRNIPDIKYPHPQGAFYVFLDISAYLTPNVHFLKDDVTFCLELLERKCVGMVPGSAFFNPGFIRISYSCSEKSIKEGIARFVEFLSEIKNEL